MRKDPKVKNGRLTFFSSGFLCQTYIYHNNNGDSSENYFYSPSINETPRESSRRWASFISCIKSAIIIASVRFFSLVSFFLYTNASPAGVSRRDMKNDVVLFGPLTMPARSAGFRGLALLLCITRRVAWGCTFFSAL